MGRNIYITILQPLTDEEKAMKGPIRQIPTMMIDKDHPVKGISKEYNYASTSSIVEYIRKRENLPDSLRNGVSQSGLISRFIEYCSIERKDVMGELDKLIEHATKEAELYNLRISGGISGAICDPLSPEALKHAEEYYEELRHRKDDITKIAAVTQYTTDQILIVKQYLFIISSKTMRTYQKKQSPLGAEIAKF